MTPRLSIIAAAVRTASGGSGGGGAYDQYWHLVTLAMQMDGANGSTTFVDLIGNTCTPGSGTVISTAQSKFGGASGRFNYDGLSISSGPLNLGTADFTIEAWVYPGANERNPFLYIPDSGAFGIDLGNNTIRYPRCYFAGYEIVSPSEQLIPGVFNHFAISRQGTLLRLFVNGIKGAEVTISSGQVFNSDPTFIGRSGYNLSYFEGYMDDVRVTKGVARYTADFTPPAAAFLPAYTRPGVEAVLDAMAYSSGQVWANLTQAPASGAARSDYDYNLGDGASANGSDPVIQGSGTEAAYWEMDGADAEFTHTLAAGSMPAFLRALHKSGTKFTIEVWMRWDGTTATNIAPLFDSGSSDQGGSDMSRGVLFGDLGNSAGVGGKLNLRLKQDSGAGTAFTKTSDAVIPSGAVQMLAVSFDGTGTEASFFYRNGAYMQAGSADTWTASLASPGTADTANRSKIGARGDGAYHVPSGTRIYMLRLYNRNLTKAELDVNWNGTKGRYGL